MMIFVEFRLLASGFGKAGPGRNQQHQF